MATVRNAMEDAEERRQRELARRQALNSMGTVRNNQYTEADAERDRREAAARNRIALPVEGRGPGKKPAIPPSNLGAAQPGVKPPSPPQPPRNNLIPRPWTGTGGPRFMPTLPRPVQPPTTRPVQPPVQQPVQPPVQGPRPLPVFPRPVQPPVQQPVQRPVQPPSTKPKPVGGPVQRPVMRPPRKPAIRRIGGIPR